MAKKKTTKRVSVPRTRNVKSNRAGEFLIDKNGQKTTIISYNGADDCDILYDDKYKTVVKAAYREFKNRSIKNPNYPSVEGVGFLGQGDHAACINRKPTKAYYVWKSILKRCYNEKYKEKHTTYKDCILDERWHCFQKYAEWHIENYKDGFEIDKDLLVQGNKIYGPETCVFIPTEINNRIRIHISLNSEKAVGVKKEFNKFSAAFGRKYLGIFNTKEDASQAYKEEKRKVFINMAEKYKSTINKAAYVAIYELKI